MKDHRSEFAWIWVSDRGINPLGSSTKWIQKLYDNGRCFFALEIEHKLNNYRTICIFMDSLLNKPGDGRRKRFQIVIQWKRFLIASLCRDGSWEDAGPFNRSGWKPPESVRNPFALWFDRLANSSPRKLFLFSGKSIKAYQVTLRGQRTRASRDDSENYWNHLMSTSSHCSDRN